MGKPKKKKKKKDQDKDKGDKIDKRKNNKGASKRVQYTYWQKSEALLKLMDYQKDKEIKNPYKRAADDHNIAVSTLWK